jgi:F-type H+/Na+-transporting ATPase subunit alpha
VSIFLVDAGYFDSVPVGDVRRFNSELLESLHRSAAEAFKAIEGGKKIEGDAAEQIKTETDRFKQGFIAADGSRVVNEAAAGELDHEEVESVSVHRKHVEK